MLANSPDLSACEREPVHIPGAIQSHGVLVAFDLPTWEITHASANAGELFGFPDADAMLGCEIKAILSPTMIHDLRNTFQGAMISGFAERMGDIPIGVDERPHDLLVHASGQLAIVEFVPSGRAESTRSDPIMLVKVIVDRLRRTKTFPAFLTAAARQIRAITGYDRVMIYRFMEDDSGQVVAEALRSGLTPYMHLHYPASDIPPQARALYKRQWLRQIPDVDYQPVPVMPGFGKNGLPIDLSLASLRSVSPVHLQYLRNMGSAATLTVSIMQGDRLWGLIACHHETPRLLATTLCGAVELFAQVFSSQIEAKEQQDGLNALVHARRTHDELIAGMEPEETIFDNLQRFSGLLREMIPCDGIGIWSNDRFEGEGVVPPANAVGELVRFLSAKQADRVFATNHLGDDLPDAMRYAGEVSGLLAIPFSRAPRDFLLLFRNEMVQTVLWGGDPHKAVQVDGTGGIGPRKSFAAWREIVRGKSVPWSEAALTIAETLRVSLLDVILRRANLVDRERRIAQEGQLLLVAELNHRVKNVLAVIGSLVRQSQQGSQTLELFTASLQDRIQALSIAHDQLTRSHWKVAPLRALIEAEGRAWTDTADNRFTLDGPPVMIEARAYQTLALVLHEMMTNAAKYGALSGNKGRLAVSWSLDDDLTLLWEESDGPLVTPPSRRGFGTVITEQSIAFELRGTAAVTYNREGVRARFTIPAEFVTKGSEEVADPVPRTVKANLEGKSLLLVEDSMMIALDAQAMLQSCGADVEVASTISDARRAIKLNQFDAAILDINLYTETSYPIAEDLQGLQIPFVFASGYGETVSVPERFKDVVVVSKPYAEDTLRTALAA